MIRMQVQQQAVKGARVSDTLNGTICKNKWLNVEVKIRIYKFVVRLILTYAMETCAEHIKQNHYWKGKNKELAKDSWEDTNGHFPITKKEEKEYYY